MKNFLFGSLAVVSLSACSAGWQHADHNDGGYD